MNKADIILETTLVLNNLGMESISKGYQYVREAIVMCIEEPEKEKKMNKNLYEPIAEKHNTTSQKVNSSIRYAIKKADIDEELKRNGEFIRTVAGIVRLKLKG